MHTRTRHGTHSVQAPLPLSFRVVAIAVAVCSAARVTIDNTVPRVADNEDVPMNAHDGALLDFSSDPSLGARKYVVHDLSCMPSDILVKFN